eukprot:m.137312 g.137312  ORF g.137312 m.137312 type:complete len:898 (-) comp16051_c0_seq7:1009-3702(-)
MTSLTSSLPQDSWGIAQSDEEARFEAEMRIRHVAIVTTTLRSLPRPHVVYGLEVSTATDRWVVFRRYSAFNTLHQQLVKLKLVKKSLLPSKKLTGSLASSVILQRQTSLQNYLQRLINSDRRVALAQPLLQFLEVHKHDVVAVAAKMARHFRQHGRRLLKSKQAFNITPNQCRCAARRRLLPMHAFVSEQRMLGSKDAYGQPDDLPFLFEYLQHVTHVRIHPKRDSSIGPNDEMPIDETAIDMTIFSNLTMLEISHHLAAKIRGMETVQAGLQGLRLRHCGLSAMKQVLRDAVTVRQKPQAPPPTSHVESWRSNQLHKLSRAHVVVKPWAALRSLDMSSNEISMMDPTCLELLPQLQQLDLSYNHLDSINPWLYKGVVLNQLVRLNLSFNDINTLHAPTLDPDEAALFPSTRSASMRGESPRKPTTYVKPAGPEGDCSQPAALPTTDNRAPPAYDSPHLISTHNPNAPLDELQRERAKRWREQQAHHVAGSSADEPVDLAANEFTGEALDPGATLTKDLVSRLSLESTGSASAGPATRANPIDISPVPSSSSSSSPDARTTVLDVDGSADNGHRNADNGNGHLSNIADEGGQGAGDPALKQQATSATPADVAPSPSSALAAILAARQASPKYRQPKQRRALNHRFSIMSNLSFDQSQADGPETVEEQAESLLYEDSSDDEICGSLIMTQAVSQAIQSHAPADRTPPRAAVEPSPDSRGAPSVASWDSLSGRSDDVAASPRHAQKLMRKAQAVSGEDTDHLSSSMASSASSLANRDEALQALRSMRSNSIASDFSSYWMPSRSALSFHIVAPALRELYMTNNLLASLKGLERCDRLEVLDVRNNRITSLSGVASIINLPALTQLFLEGNPLANHKEYRVRLWTKYPDRRFAIDSKSKP